MSKDQIFKVLSIAFLIWALLSTVGLAYFYDQSNKYMAMYNSLYQKLEHYKSLSYVYVIIDYSNGTIEKHRVSIIEGKNNTVFDALKAVATINYTYYQQYQDVFIDAINGVWNNKTAGYYWLFYVNGKLSVKGAMNTHVYDGDRIVWNYTKVM